MAIEFIHCDHVDKDNPDEWYQPGINLNKNQVFFCCHQCEVKFEAWFIRNMMRDAIQENHRNNLKRSD